MSRLTRFPLALLLSLLTATVVTVGAGWLWETIGGRPMSVHGWIALGIGMFGTIGLTWTLMSLAFRSNREGWDDRVDNSLDPGRGPDEG